jgi:hypothetical protein
MTMSISSSDLAEREGWSYEDYVSAWRQVDERAQWVKGDLALNVPTKYGEATLERYAADVGTPYETVKRLRSVAAAYPRTGPRGPNSWSVYRELAAQDDRLELVASRPKDKCSWSEAETWTVALARQLVQ